MPTAVRESGVQTLAVGGGGGGGSGGGGGGDGGGGGRNGCIRAYR